MGTGKKRRDFTPFVHPTVHGFLSRVHRHPLIHGLLLSLQEWSLLSDPVFVGLDNYIELLDVRRFRAAVQNTFMFAVQSVPLLLVVPLVLALFLNKTFVGQKLAQNAIISPFLIPQAVCCCSGSGCSIPRRA